MITMSEVTHSPNDRLNDFDIDENADKIFTVRCVS